MSSRPRSRREELVESIAQGALLLADDDRVLAINDAARQLLAIGPEDPVRTAADVLTHRALVAAVGDVRATGRAVTVEADHHGARLSVNVSMLRDEVLLLITDRTEQHRVEELRRDFVANASHELKTPVTGIQALVDALSVVVDADPPRVRPLIDQLAGEAERLALLVHDLLDLRRLEEHGPVDRASVDLAELIRRVVAAQVDRAERLDVELSVEAPAQLHVTGAVGDHETIVRNLVRNAITYNRPGGTVQVGLRAQDAGAHVELVVADTGRGIDPVDLPRIFERFYRGETTRWHHTDGTGLGLSIVRHAVDNLGGSIDVDSRVDHGSSFTVVLPAGRPA